MLYQEFLALCRRMRLFELSHRLYVSLLLIVAWRVTRAHCSVEMSATGVARTTALASAVASFNSLVFRSISTYQRSKTPHSTATLPTYLLTFTSAPLPLKSLRLLFTDVTKCIGGKLKNKKSRCS